MIRGLKEKDQTSFLKIRKASLYLEPKSFCASLGKEFNPESDQLDLKNSNDENFILGYFESDDLIGILGFIREQKMKKRHKAFIWGFFVYPEHRGKGVGAELFRECIKRAQSMRGLEKIQLSVTGASPKAILFYTNFHFKTYGTEEKSVKWRDEYIDEIYMERTL